jgi:hypothetical protein
MRPRDVERLGTARSAAVPRHESERRNSKRPQAPPCGAALRARAARSPHAAPAVTESGTPTLEM